MERYEGEGKMGVVTKWEVFSATGDFCGYLVIELLAHLLLPLLVWVIEGVVSVLPLRPCQGVQLFEESHHPFLGRFANKALTTVVAGLKEGPVFGGQAQQEVVPANAILFMHDLPGGRGDGQGGGGVLLLVSELMQSVVEDDGDFWV